MTNYKTKIINHIKRNRNKRDLFIANIPHVSTSGMQRQIKFGIIYNGKFENVTYFIAEILGEKLTAKYDAIKVDGCGMDMIFHTLETLYRKLGYKETYKLNAVQNYRRF